MTAYQSVHDRPGKLALMMAAIPSVDCVLNQVNTAFGISVSGMSLLQLVRGALILIFFCLCARVLMANPTRLKQVPLAVPTGMLLIGAAISKELCETGTVVVVGIVPYGQMLYWLLMWAVVVLLCSKPPDARVILKGIAAGAVMTAASVFLGLAVGTGNFYRTDAVQASAGWFETAKMITGVLTTGGVVLLFLGWRSRSWHFPVFAWLVFSACIVTYARAGTVALIVSLMWLFVWVSIWGRQDSGLAKRFAILGALLCIVGTASISPTQLFARWNDVEGGATAGSGRATFWKIAVDAFAEDHLFDQVAGQGYSSMSAMLYDRYGDDIKHTHNDALDMMLVGGIAGCMWLLLFIADLVSMVLRCPMSSPARAAAVAILLIYLCHSQLTGQIWGTDSMTYYTLSLSSIAVLQSAAHRERVHGPQGCPAKSGRMIYTDLPA
jgi:hypothetical protein